MKYDCTGTCRRGACDCGAYDTAGGLKDGATVHFSMPLMMKDSAASLRISDYADSRGVSESQAAYEMRLGDAWKARPGAIQPLPEGAAPVAASPATPVVTGDNGQAAYEARLKAAWQRSVA